MKVSEATKVLSHDVGVGIQYFVQKEGRSINNLPTAWFIKKVARWFDLRHPVLALSKVSQEKYEEAVGVLQDIIELFQSIKIGCGEWKPIQTRIILSTKSIMEITQELLESGHKFVLTGRFTQDCLENLFSMVRMRKQVPSPLEFKAALKLIAASQFLAVPHSGSYSVADSDYLADLSLKSQPLSKSQPENEVVDIVLPDDTSTHELSQSDKDSSFCLDEYCLHSIVVSQIVCDSCLKFVTADSSSGYEAADLTLMKEFKQGSLVKVSPAAL